GLGRRGEVDLERDREEPARRSRGAGHLPRRGAPARRGGGAARGGPGGRGVVRGPPPDLVGVRVHGPAGRAGVRDRRRLRVGRLPGPTRRPRPLPAAPGRGAFDRQRDGGGGVQDGHRQAPQTNRGAVEGAAPGADGGVVLLVLWRPTRNLLEEGGRVATRFRYRTPPVLVEGIDRRSDLLSGIVGHGRSPARGEPRGVATEPWPKG